MKTAYRGYLITQTFSGWAISKDGFHICWATSGLAGAKSIIDGLVS